MLKLLIPLLLAAAMLAGCGQVSVFGRTIGEQSAAPEIKSEAAAPAVAATPQVLVVKSVTLAITPQATAKVGGDVRFNSDALLAAIKHDLTLRKVLDSGNAQASTAEISLEDYAMRPTSNAIVFGKIISRGMLIGTLSLRDAHGNELVSRQIKAETSVSIPATGETPVPLAPLYREFAVLTGHFLAGTKPKPTIGADQHPRE